MTVVIQKIFTYQDIELIGINMEGEMERKYQNSRTLGTNNGHLNKVWSIVNNSALILIHCEKHVYYMAILIQL